ncbi:MAG: hypothetical protein WBG18_21135 [Xanthobacteraceae bacterium]
MAETSQRDRAPASVALLRRQAGRVEGAAVVHRGEAEIIAWE